MYHIHRLVRLCLLVLALFMTVVEPPEVLGQTWAPVEIVCPLCGEKNLFMKVIQSPRSRIASRYQLLYWPDTDKQVLYSCHKCRLTTFLWDFEKVPRDKHDALKKALDTVQAYDKPVKRYYELPMPWRMAVAEKVYLLLEKDDEFWCYFRRIEGLLLEQEGKKTLATEARKKSLALADKMLSDSKHAGRAKAVLAIKGSMHYYTGAYTEAVKTLELARQASYENKAMRAKQLDEYVKHLDDVIQALLRMARLAVEQGGKDK